MIIQQAETDDYRLEVFMDDMPMNPREEPFETFGTMVCFHDRFELGDENHGFQGEEDLHRYLTKNDHKLVYLPIFYSDRGVYTNQYESIDLLLESNYCVGAIFAHWVGDVTEIFKRLKEAIKKYDYFVRGEIYGFNLEEKDTCPTCGTVHYELIDSCGGFYGTSDMIEGMQEIISEDYRHLFDSLREV